MLWGLRKRVVVGRSNLNKVIVEDLPWRLGPKENTQVKCLLRIWCWNHSIQCFNITLVCFMFFLTQFRFTWWWASLSTCLGDTLRALPLFTSRHMIFCKFDQHGMTIHDLWRSLMTKTPDKDFCFCTLRFCNNEILKRWNVAYTVFLPMGSSDTPELSLAGLQLSSWNHCLYWTLIAAYCEHCLQNKETKQEKGRLIGGLPLPLFMSS